MYHTSQITHILLFLTLCVSRGSADVVTSSEKMAELAALEQKLLKQLKNRALARTFMEFVERRTKELHYQRDRNTVDVSSHPSGAYLMIKAFLTVWKDVFSIYPDLDQLSDYEQSLLPSVHDLHGAMSSILRLQRIFALPVKEMYAGNCSGHMGPPLQPMDAYEIGRQGFIDSDPDLCVLWLETALRENKDTQEQNIGPDVTKITMSTKMADGGMTDMQRAAVLGLLGRAYLRTGEVDRAKDVYREAEDLDPSNGDVQTLGRELTDPSSVPRMGEPSPVFLNTSRLCSRDKKHILENVRPYHICRYKPSLVAPYVMYKEEILSLSPYASLFHAVISDHEIKAVKQFVRGKMYRGQVERLGNEPAQEVSASRTSDLGWIADNELPVAQRLSVRIMDMTWLDTEQPWPHRPNSGEKFQVVNYGVGGHYSAHFDILRNPLGDALKNSGTRLATFLIYLTDVEKGGQTIFLNAGISVPPVKGMALFWYNYSPAMELEELTLHAGCPVLKGHKWIANKWIWTYGNTFRRPCGPSPQSTQRDIEKIIA